jgi:hypothetical protein
MPHIFFFPESAPCAALYLRRIRQRFWAAQVPALQSGLEKMR